MQQLRNLQKGLRPRTRALLPPPVPIDPSMDVPPEMTAAYSSQEGRTYGLATPDTLSPTLRAMLERVRKRAADRLTEIPVAKRRIVTKTTPGAAGSSSNALLCTRGAVPAD